MFSWICPKCGKEVPPSASECPYCATDAQSAASAQPTLPTIPIPPGAQGTPPPPYYPPQQQMPPQYQQPYPTGQYPQPQGQYPPPQGQYPPQYQQPYPQPPYPQQYPPQGYPQQAPYPPQYAPQQAPMGAPQAPPQQPQTPQAPQAPAPQLAPAPAPAAPVPTPPSFGAAPAAPAAPATYIIDDGPQRSFPAWAAVLLAFAGVALLVYGIVSYTSSRRAGGDPKAAKAAAAAKGRNPYQKDLEISGFRISEVGKKLKVTFVAINHGSYEMADIKGDIVLRAKGAGPDDPPACTFKFSISSIAPFSTKEIEVSEFSQKRKFIDMPDWQFLDPQIDIMAPAQ